MFQGTFTALITPFSKDGSFDEKSFRDLIERQIKNGVDGIVPCGTTGESPTLSEKEHIKVIEVAVDQVVGRVKVIAGTGSNCTKEAVERTIKAKKLGIDGSLQIAPYYNKPSEKGFYEHFKTIAEAVHIPIIIYNVPGRSGKKVEADTILRLAKNYKNIVAVKDATCNVIDTMAVFKNAPKHFSILAGDDALSLAMIALGAKGLISVASNLYPKEVSAMIQFALNGNLEKSREIHYKFLDFFNACFYESNPIPIKTMMAVVGLCEEIFRLPLCAPSDENKAKMKKVLDELKNQL